MQPSGGASLPPGLERTRPVGDVHLRGRSPRFVARLSLVDGADPGGTAVEGAVDRLAGTDQVLPEPGERAAEQPGDVHLGGPDARSDLRLGHVAVEAKLQHPASRSGNRASAQPSASRAFGRPSVCPPWTAAPAVPTNGGAGKGALHPAELATPGAGEAQVTWPAERRSRVGCEIARRRPQGAGEESACLAVVYADADWLRARFDVIVGGSRKEPPAGPERSRPIGRRAGPAGPVHRQDRALPSGRPVAACQRGSR
jgi:hypothetical protein